RAATVPLLGLICRARLTAPHAELPRLRGRDPPRARRGSAARLRRRGSRRRAVRPLRGVLPRSLAEADRWEAVPERDGGPDRSRLRIAAQPHLRRRGGLPRAALPPRRSAGAARHLLRTPAPTRPL